MEVWIMESHWLDVVGDFHHTREIVPIKEMFELWEIKLLRASCTKYFIK